MTPTQEDDHARDWLAIDAVIGCAFDDDSDDDAAADRDLVDESEVIDLDSSDPDRIAQLQSAISLAIDHVWRSRLATAQAARQLARPVPLARERPRTELLARLGVLRDRFPALVAQHRSLTADSDATLRAMIEDIEAVTGDRDE